MTSPAPDYADPQNWFAQPERVLSNEAVVFYVHPTTYPGELWNGNLATAPGMHDATAGIVARQTAPFAASCRVFAPRYRQASSRAFHERGTGADAAYALAYEDVCAAFRHYLRHWHQGGLILLGHSQGALHVGRLLAELLEPEGLVPDLIAAYAVGIGFSEALFGTRYRIIAPCEKPDQTRCLISWSTFLEGGDPSGVLQRTGERDAVHLNGKPPGTPICINPVSFDAGRPAMPGARVQGGIVWIDAAPSEMTALPGGNMHMHDLALFEPSIAEDVPRRITARRSDGSAETIGLVRGRS